MLEVNNLSISAGSYIIISC